MTTTRTRNVLASFATCAALAAALLFASVSPAHATGPLANCNPGQPFLWPAGGSAIPFNPDLGDLGPLTNAQAVAAVQSSFDVWGNVANSRVGYVNAGRIGLDADGTIFGTWTT